MQAMPLERGQRWRGLKATGVVLAAAITGALTAKPLLTALMERQATHNGPWRTSVNTGSASANPWERAAVAVAGLYGLTPREAIYFTAFSDSSGAALSGACRYRVQGAVPSVRWWSLTVYGADHYLVPNSAGRYSQSPGSLPASAEGRFDIALSADARGEATLPLPARGAFSLTLRLYNPPPALLATLDSTPLPTITREECA